MIRIPDPNDPTKVLELTDEEFRHHCAELYAADKKLPDGSNKAEYPPFREWVRLFNDGARRA